MVDLVKIRKKAKERKKGAETAPPMSPEATGTKAVRRTPVSRPVRAAAKKGASGRKGKPTSNRAVRRSVETGMRTEPVEAVVAVVQPAPATFGETMADDRPGAAVAASMTETPEPDAASKKGSSEVSLAPEVIPDKLLEFRQSAGTATAESESRSKSSAEEEASNQIELLTFVVAGEQYTVEIENIVEIITPRPSTRVPNSPATTLGIISLRGTIVTLLDVRRILGHPPLRELPVDARIVVVQHREETAGFLVDRVSRVIKIDPGEIENHPVVSAAEQSDLVRGVFRHRDSLMILLDLEKLLIRG